MESPAGDVEVEATALTGWQSGIRHLAGVTVGVCMGREGEARGDSNAINPKLLKPVRQTHLHGEKVAPRYRNLQHEHREGKGKEEDKVDDDEEEEEFINTSSTKRAEDDDERYEDDSFEDESNSPVNKQRLREPQNYSSRVP